MEPPGPTALAVPAAEAAPHPLPARGALAVRWRVVVGDRFFRLAAVFCVATFAANLIAPLFDDSLVIETLFDLGFLLLTVWAVRHRLGALPRRERRFWNLLALGFLSWAFITGLYLVVPQRWLWWPTGVTIDFLFLAFYLCALLAVESRLDLPPDHDAWDLHSHFRVPGAVVFCCGLFLYFVLIPSLLDPGLYDARHTSFYLFVALDLYLAGRLWLLSRAASTARWRHTYRLAAWAFAVFALSDLVEWVWLTDLVPAVPAPVWAVAWSVPSLVVVVLIRLRSWPADDAAEVAEPRAEAGLVATPAPFFAYFLILPLLHFGCYRAGLFDGLTRPAHETCVLVWLGLVGAVALVQHLHLLSRTRDLLDERRQVQERIWYLANFDAVTGLPNRVLLEDRLDQALKRAARDGRLVALVFVDLDDFKRINDSFGHAAGDALLEACGERLTGRVRDSDTVARFGGDEFTVILDGLAESPDAELLVLRIGAAFAEPFTIAGLKVMVSASLGAAVFPGDGTDAETLIKNADSAMYESKRGRSGNQPSVRFFAEEVHGPIRDRLLLEQELREAVERQEFVLHFQPKWRVCGTVLTGLEALIRWRHPGRGLLLPAQFIAVAERTGVIHEIDRWVLGAACAQAAAWRRPGCEPVSIAVNLSADMFRDAQLPALVRRLLAEHQLDPGALELELTETMVMADRQATARIIQELGKEGVTITIDDFGAGSSSLQYLTELCPHKIKIDRTFVRGLISDQRSRAVVVGILGMAHRLDLTVVAEGVEEEQERAFLADYGCDEVQGYLLGRPQPARWVTETLLASADPFERDRRFSRAARRRLRVVE